MKKFHIEASIDASDSYSAGDVLSKIDSDLNRGDGVYLDIDDATCVSQDKAQDGGRIELCIDDLRTCWKCEANDTCPGCGRRMHEKEINRRIYADYGLLWVCSQCGMKVPTYKHEALRG